MAGAIAADLAVQWGTHNRTPGLFLVPAVMAVAVLSGTAAGMLAAAAAAAFAAFDLFGAGPAQPPLDRIVRLAVVAVLAPALAALVGGLRRRVVAEAAGQLRDGLATAQRGADAKLNAAQAAFAVERSALIRERDALATVDANNQRRLADLIAAVPGVVWESVVDESRLRVAFISNYVQDLLGYEASRWTGSDALWSTAVHVDDRDRVSRWLATACATATSSLANAAPVEFRWVAKDGSTVWVETRLAATPARDGMTGVTLRGVTSDITQRKTLESALAARAAELAHTAEHLRASNDELDQFAYVTSHDLKAPLRGIANLSNWIEEDLGPDRVTAEARSQFNLLRGRVHRMERLIDGLLQYSRVGRESAQVEWVAVGELLAEVIDWVGPPQHVRIAAGSDLPAFNADRLRLGQVLANLIGNAVKHRAPGAGWVRVSAEVTTLDGPDAMDGYAFTVADDGPGIDPRFHDRIFGVFQTLRSRDQIEGTGIGLALVRKVVTGKGGRVTVNSTAGHGATFRFTWPRVDPTADRVVRVQGGYCRPTVSLDPSWQSGEAS